ncbi:hypothetical protein ACLOJK_005538 [Asimina triloba]
MPEKNKPTNLLDLLRKSTVSQGFKGVFEFDTDRVPSIALAEPPNCWALPVATLTTIAVAIHYNNKRAIECLLRGVHEGLGYVRLVEKTLDAEGPINMKEAADSIWLDVDVYNPAQLLGEAENILLMVGQKACFDLDPNQMAYIDEWRLAKQKNMPSVVSPSDDESKLNFSLEELSLIIE